MNRQRQGLQVNNSTEKMRKTRYCSVLVFVGVAFAASCLFLGCGRSDDGGARGASAGATEVVVGNETYVALKSENEALRRENQMLRRELISKNGKLPDAVLPEKGKDSGSVVEAGGEDTGYWLATNSKVRHNKRCRNYRKVKGRPCGPDEGRPCKMCGG